MTLLALGLTVSIPGLEKALQQYTLEPSEKPFDLKSVPLATTPMAEQRPGKALLIPKAHLFPLTVEWTSKEGVALATLPQVRRDSHADSLLFSEELAFTTSK